MAGKLTGKRILVVEDEYFIASDLSRALQQEAATVLGPVGRVAAGLALANDGLDGAVLDINLEGDDTYALADRLSQYAVPYMFVTGYDDWSIPAAYRDMPRMVKPFSTDQVVEALVRLVGGSAS